MMLIDVIGPGPMVHTGAPAGRGPVRVQRNAGGSVVARRSPQTGPGWSRPGGAPLRQHGAGVAVSRAPHRRTIGRGQITPATTVVLALIAAAITVWLGLVAQFGAAMAGGVPTVPDQLGVVRVESGESLQHLAARVAPDAPTGQVVARIRELNSLDSSAVDVGQTLIAPIG